MPDYRSDPSARTRFPPSKQVEMKALLRGGEVFGPAETADDILELAADEKKYTDLAGLLKKLGERGAAEQLSVTYCWVNRVQDVHAHLCRILDGAAGVRVRSADFWLHFVKSDDNLSLDLFRNSINVLHLACASLTASLTRPLTSVLKANFGCSTYDTTSEMDKLRTSSLMRQRPPLAHRRPFANFRVRRRWMLGYVSVKI